VIKISSSAWRCHLLVRGCLGRAYSSRDLS